MKLFVAFLLVLLAVVLLLPTLPAQASTYCLLCDHGNCVENSWGGGSCVCVTGGYGTCLTFGICVCNPPSHCACTASAEQLDSLTMYLESHPNAHVTVTKSCKKGRQVVQQIEEAFAREGKKLSVTYN